MACVILKLIFKISFLPWFIRSFTHCVCLYIECFIIYYAWDMQILNLWVIFNEHFLNCNLFKYYFCSILNFCFRSSITYILDNLTARTCFLNLVCSQPHSRFLLSCYEEYGLNALAGLYKGLRDLTSASSLTSRLNSSVPFMWHVCFRFCTSGFCCDSFLSALLAESHPLTFLGSYWVSAC